jgi:uncharacterized protein (TIGR03435 family)
MAVRWVTCAAPVLLGLAVCQQRTDLPSFEVASVKPAAPGPPGVFLGSSTKIDPGRVSYTNTLLQTLIVLAYNVEYYQVSGAPWLESERYDVIAKLPDNAAKKDIPLMLQRLLLERFHFAYHTLTKEVMMHVIVADKSGPKLDEAAEEELDAKGVPKRHPIIISGGRITAKRVRVSDLAWYFSHLLEEPVLDLTKIQARFNVDAPFRIEREETGAGEPGSEGTASTGLAARPIFYPAIVATLTRLGLSLERRKAPMTFIVVDHADRIPVAN